MKTIVTTFTLFVALCAASGAMARVASLAPAPDAVLVSETIEGNYLVRRFVVKQQADADYPLRYRIDMALLSSTFDNNSKELSELNMFLENLMNDPLMRVETVHIVGYSSPDGPVAINETLAKKRAMDFKNYVDRKYGFSTKFNVKTSWVAEDWEMCRALVAESAVPDKQAVLKTIDGKWSPDQKETALKKMPTAWAYMKKNILPTLRRVELVIDYAQDMVIEERMMIVKPQYVELQVCEPCSSIPEETLITGFIVETDGPGSDFDRDMRHAQKRIKADMNLDRREMRAADKLARKEAREIKKMIRAEAKAAERMAKSEAKAAHKAAK